MISFERVPSDSRNAALMSMKNTVFPSSSLAMVPLTSSLLSFPNSRGKTPSSRIFACGVFAFSLGALLYYVVFYRSQLIPRWLSGWGIAGVLLMLTACVLALFSSTSLASQVAPPSRERLQ